MKIKQFIPALLLIMLPFVSQAQKGGSIVKFVPKVLNNIQLNEAYNSTNQTTPYIAIFNEDLLLKMTNAKQKNYKIDFENNFVLVIYNKAPQGSVNLLGASFYVKKRYLKVGYSYREKGPFEPYKIILVNKTDFNKLEVLPYKKYNRAKDRTSFNL
jgi:hypothetical protein